MTDRIAKLRRREAALEAELESRQENLSASERQARYLRGSSSSTDLRSSASAAQANRLREGDDD